MTERIYFDWNATAPLRAEADAAMTAALELTGNASSVHAEGRAARHVIDDARQKVAVLGGAEARNVTFTIGATEANMLALTPAIDGGAKALARQAVCLGHRAPFGACRRPVSRRKSGNSAGRFPMVCWIVML